MRVLRCFFSLVSHALLACILLSFALIDGISQTLPRTATTPGAPAGSYSLGDQDSINVFTGNLSYNLPLLKIGGRGDAQAQLGIVLEQQWTRYEVPVDPAPLIQHQYVNQAPYPLAFVGSVRIQEESVQQSGICNNSTGNLWQLDYFSVIYTEPNGTEHLLRDQRFHGYPVQVCMSGETMGTVFESANDDFVTFVSDATLYSHCFPTSICVNGSNHATGYLYFRNGTKARTIDGRIQWLQDRNGNRIDYQYGSASHTNLPTKITDPLGREINIAYDVVEDTYGRCTKITFHGLNGDDKVIRISHDVDVTHLLRLTQPYDATLGNGGFEVNDPNDDVSLIGGTQQAIDYVKAVWLPDNRKYEFKYNRLGQLARVDLPTGGAIEYDFADLFQMPFPVMMGELGPLTNSVSEKRVYDKDNVLVSRTAFSKPTSFTSHVSPATRGETVRDVEVFEPNGNRVSKSRHYFYGLPDTRYPLTTPWWHGREFRTEVYDLGGTTLLRVSENDWRQRGPVCQLPCPSGQSEQSHTNNPFIVEEKSTLVSGNLVTKTSSVNPTSGALAFDDYNNPTDVWEYDYGVGQAGSLRLHAHNVYVNNANAPGGLFLIGLLTSKDVYSVNAGQETLRESTQIAYDEYTPSTYSTVIQWQNPSTVRGNVTTLSRWLSYPASSWLSTHNWYDQLGNVCQTSDAKGNQRQISYLDSFSDNISRNTYAFPTHITTPVPDSSGGHGSTSALVTSSVYDFSTGLQVAAIDANFKTTTYEYNDPLNRLKKVTRPDGSWTTNEYSDAVNALYVRTQTLRQSSPTQQVIDSYQYFDGLGRPTKSYLYDGTSGTPWVVTETKYDSLNRTAQVSNPYRVATVGTTGSADWTTTVYDAESRITHVFTPDGAHVDTEYGVNTITPIATTVTVTDQALRKRRSLIDAFGRLVRVDEPACPHTPCLQNEVPDLGNVSSPNQPTLYTYILDELVTVTQGTQTRYFMYDSLGRLIRARNPEQSVNSNLNLSDSLIPNSQWCMSYAYDDNGNLVVKTDARGVSTHYKYDRLNRITQRWYNNSSAVQDTPTSETLPTGVAVSPQANFYYDLHLSTSPFFDFQNQDSSRGRLTAVTYGTNSTEGDYYRYDSLGRVFSKIQRIASKDFLITAQFNKADAITLLTYPSNRSVTNAFDTAGRLNSMSGNLGNSQKTYSTGILYTPNGSLTKEEFGTNKAIYSELFYNSRQQLVEIWARTTDSVVPNRGKITNRYSLQCPGVDCTDNNGNLRKQEMNIPGDNLDQASTRTTWYQQYDYDELNRLARVHEYTGNTSKDWQQEYVYDRWGNRTINQNADKTWGTNIPKPDYHVDPANNNRLTAPSGYSLQYDVAGNVTSDTLSGTGTRKYDAENRMTEWGDPNGSYSYDANGRRVRRKVAGVETWQIYGLDGELLAEYPANGAQDSPTKEYGYRNGQLLITAESGNGLAAPVFADNFDDNLFNTSAWTKYYSGAPTVSEQSMQLQVALSLNTAAYNGVYSNSTYDLTGKMLQVELPQAVSQAGWCENYLELELNANNYLLIQVGAGNLLLRSRVNGVNDQTSIPFDPSAHRFWRIRHDQNANVIYFETSANDTVWISRKTVTPGFSLTSLRVDLLAGCYGTGNSSPGTVKYDNVKLLSSTAGSTSLSIPNAGFEAPVIGNGSWQYSPTGGLWSFASGGGISGMNSAFTGTPSAAPEGVQIAFIQTNGTISQSISGFQANTNYVITFSAAQRSNCCNTGGQDIQVYLDSDLKGTFHPSGGVYAEYSTANFTTTAGSHIVKFVGLNPGGGDHTAFIDNVRINGSPKPGYGIQWLVSDQLGTPRMVFDESGGLANVKRHDYLPFGEEIGSNVGTRTAGLGYSASDGVRQQFTAKERDIETGLDYFGARYFSSVQGRFTSVDPENAGSELFDPQSWNAYSYGGNAPLTFYDPSGLWKEVPCNSGKGMCWQAEKGDSIGSLARLLNLNFDELNKHFQKPNVGTGQIYDVSGFFRNNTTVIYANVVEVLLVTEPPQSQGQVYIMATVPALNADPEPRSRIIGEALAVALYMYLEQQRKNEWASYIPPPQNLPAFPDAVRVRRKNNRVRWQDSDGNIYEWDYQHGRVEKYNKRGKHLGEFDPNTGEQTKPADPSRTTDP